MLKNMTKRERREEVTYSLFFAFKDCSGAGYSFPCDMDGKLEPLRPEAQASLNHVQDNPCDYRAPYVQRFVSQWTEPASGVCECGRRVILSDGLDNVCECGRCYNMSGQEVVPSWQCDECGEPFDY